MVKSENLILVSLLALLTSLLATQGLAAPTLDTLHLQPNERIVIIAPHPDDEVIACGGLIQAALSLNDQVVVVYVTSGDGSLPSAWRITGNLFPGPEDYIELGRARMEEARAGAKVLGLDTAHLVFLGFPDGELDRLVFEHHYGPVPVTSSHTKRDRSLYDPSRFWFRGRDIMLALFDLVGWRPVDRIFFPHPLDAHPDHWATAALLPAIRKFWHSPTFPVIHYYLVHRPPYPGAYVDAAGRLHPPEELTGNGHHWYTLPMTERQQATKLAALKCHWSQSTELGTDLTDYITSNELFDTPDPDGCVARGDAPATALPFCPRIDSVTASLSSPGRSVFKLYLDDAPAAPLDYRLHVWSFGPVIIDYTVDLEEDTSDQARARVRLIAADAGAKIDEPVSARFDGGWVAYLPSRWFNNNFMVYFTADARFRGRLLNHSGVGWAVPGWY